MHSWCCFCTLFIFQRLEHISTCTRFNNYYLLEYVVNFSIKFCICNRLAIDIFTCFLMIVHKTMSSAVNSPCFVNCMLKTFSALVTTRWTNMLVKFYHCVVWVLIQYQNIAFHLLLYNFTYYQIQYCSKLIEYNNSIHLEILEEWYWNIFQVHEEKKITTFTKIHVAYSHHENNKGNPTSKK